MALQRFLKPSRRRFDSCPAHDTSDGAERPADCVRARQVTVLDGSPPQVKCCGDTLARRAGITGSIPVTCSTVRPRGRTTMLSSRVVDDRRSAADRVVGRQRAARPRRVAVRADSRGSDVTAATRASNPVVRVRIPRATPSRADASGLSRKHTPSANLARDFSCRSILAGRVVVP